MSEIEFEGQPTISPQDIKLLVRTGRNNLIEATSLSMTDQMAPTLSFLIHRFHDRLDDLEPLADKMGGGDMLAHWKVLVFVNEAMTLNALLEDAKFLNEISRMIE